MSIIKQKMNMLILLLKEILARSSHSIMVKDLATTLDIIILEKKSVSRFGDGEFNILFRDNLEFQNYNLKLAEKLKNILIDKENNDNCLICIPYAISSLKGFTIKSSIFWLKYFAKNRGRINYYLSNEIDYYDAQVTRIYINRRDKTIASRLFGKWKEIWDERDVLLVEGATSRLGVGNTLFQNAKSVRRILCPSVNAFEKYDEIFQSILEAEHFDVCLIALGPTATVLSYDLSQKGIWAIDTGNMDIEYEWMLRRATKQVSINGKYTLEAKNGTKVSECKDKDYKTQIIKFIV